MNTLEYINKFPLFQKEMSQRRYSIAKYKGLWNNGSHFLSSIKISKHCCIALQHTDI